MIPPRDPSGPPSRFRRQVEALKAEIDFEQVFARMDEIEGSFAEFGVHLAPIPRDAKKGS